MNEILICLFLYFGGFFMLTASLGILKFPGLFTRMQASTKASSFALGCLLVAAMIFFKSPDFIFRAIATTIFVFITAPVGAHLLARAAYYLKVPLWKGTIVDDLKEKATAAPTKQTSGKGKKNNPRISEIFRNLKKFKD